MVGDTFLITAVITVSSKGKTSKEKDEDSSEEVCLTVSITGCLSDWEVFKTSVSRMLGIKIV